LIDERSIILQQWDGVVLFRDETTFTARLYEGYQDFPVKRAEIEVEEVADEQREMILPGAPFSWIIGYRVRAGTRALVFQKFTSDAWHHGQKKKSRRRNWPR
jgi:hypothetical protein